MGRAKKCIATRLNLSLLFTFQTSKERSILPPIRSVIPVLIIFVLVGWPVPACHAQTDADNELTEYRQVPGISGGNLKIVGSNTMSKILTLWSEGFQMLYPGITIEVDAKGSSIAIPTLTAGQASFGPMSRLPTKQEAGEFKSKFGYEPTLLKIGIDTVAVFVNRSNPLEGLSLPELDAIFSSTRKRGARRRAGRWKDFIDSDEWANQAITCYGRNAASGTYGFIKEIVLQNGDYGNWVGEASGSAAVVQAVAQNQGGIGYSGIGFSSPSIKALGISVQRGESLITPNRENAYNGAYPLARFLYVAVNYDERTQIDPVRAEFLRYVLSRQGQAQVAAAGYLPLTNEITEGVLAKVGLAQ